VSQVKETQRNAPSRASQGAKSFSAPIDSDAEVDARIPFAGGGEIGALQCEFVADFEVFGPRSLYRHAKSSEIAKCNVAGLAAVQIHWLGQLDCIALAVGAIEFSAYDTGNLHSRFPEIRSEKIIADLFAAAL
jgi:hypothetical protein